MVDHSEAAVRKRGYIAYGVILALLAAVLAWQAAGHWRYRADVEESAREFGGRSASNMSLIIQAQENAGFLHRDRLEEAFATFIGLRRGTLGVAVLNEGGQVLAASGVPLPADLLEKTFYEAGETLYVTVPFERPVDPGEAAQADPPLVFDPEAADAWPPPARTLGEDLLYGAPAGARKDCQAYFSDTPLDAAHSERLLDHVLTELTRPERVEKARQVLEGVPLTPERFELALRVLLLNTLPEVNAEGGYAAKLTPRAVLEDYDATAYAELVRDRGVRWFVRATDSGYFRSRIAGDLRFRLTLAGLAVLAAAGLAMAWRLLERAGRLELGLVRERERNAHLQDMNLAAAGLAHETKNPLNVIRGHAQLIGRRKDLPGGVGRRAREIIEESDRVTSRLNQFIDYSRPIEPKPEPCKPLDVAGEVARALEMVLDDKAISVTLDGANKSVLADPALLRQVFFNLMLNAANAVGQGGNIAVRTETDGNGGVSVAVSDDGPGVPEAEREAVFRPYYTGSANGTGLGLAVVCQIIHAQHWEVTCEDNGGGACFRIAGLRTVESAHP